MLLNPDYSYIAFAKVIILKNEDARLQSGPRRAYFLVRSTFGAPVSCLVDLPSALERHKWTHSCPLWHHDSRSHAIDQAGRRNDEGDRQSSLRDTFDSTVS